MRLPLLYAMSWPERIYTDWKKFDLVEAGDLTFRAPDREKYPCMELAYTAGRAGGTMPAVLSAANEQAVALFLAEQIKFVDIPTAIERVCDKHREDFQQHPSLDDIVAADLWARAATIEIAEQVNPVTIPMGTTAAATTTPSDIW